MIYEKPKNILVIDDDEDILKWFNNMNKNSASYNMHLLQDELKVLRVLDGNQPDLVFLDINLTSTSGDEIAEVIRNTWAGVPVIFMSGTTPALFNDQFSENAFMKKPLIRSVVEEKIRKFLK